MKLPLFKYRLVLVAKQILVRVMVSSPKQLNSKEVFIRWKKVAN